MNDQHLEDIVIPDIEIDRGWPVSDIKTIEDCDDAFAFLTAAVAGIELQLDLHVLKPAAYQDHEWAARARYALKFKKAALGIVTAKRSQIKNAEKQKFQREHDRRLIEYIRGRVDGATYTAWVAASGVMAIEAEEAA